MPIVQCPHCTMQVENDGTLAGQVVACPGCQGQFQMPSPQSARQRPTPTATETTSFGFQEQSQEPLIRPSSDRRRRRQTNHAGIVAVIIGVLILTAGGVAFWGSGMLQRDRREREEPQVGATDPSKTPNTKIQGLERQYEELKSKLANLQERQRELRRIKEAHDSAWRSSKSFEVAFPDELEARTKQRNEDTGAIIANGKAVFAIYQEMKLLLDQIEREANESSGDNIRERRRAIEKAAEELQSVELMPPTSPQPPQPQAAPGLRALSQPELQERENRLAAEADREKNTLPPLKDEMEKKRKALATAYKQANQRTISAQALAQSVEQFQAAERKYYDMVELIEQNRRRIKKLFPMAGDTEYFPKGNGDFYTKEEYEAAMKLPKGYGSPQNAATPYLEKLIKDKIIQKAAFLKVEDCSDPRAINPDGSPAPVRYPGGVKPRQACRKVWYQVQYVSAGGLVLNRPGYVLVYVESGQWYLLPDARYVLPDTRVVGLNLNFSN